MTGNFRRLLGVLKSERVDMKAYVVTRGEKCEGGSVVSVLSTYSQAESTALAEPCCFEGGWQKEENNYWTNECDYVLIQEFEVT